MSSFRYPWYSSKILANLVKSFGQLFEMIWNDMKWHEMTWIDTKWHEMTWIDTKWHEMTWIDIKWHKMTWNDMKLHHFIEKELYYIPYICKSWRTLYVENIVVFLTWNVFNFDNFLHSFQSWISQVTLIKKPQWKL